MCMCRAGFIVCKTVPWEGSNFKVNIKSTRDTKGLPFGTTKNRLLYQFNFVI